jgi:hypothetical protein
LGDEGGEGTQEAKTAEGRVHKQILGFEANRDGVIQMREFWQLYSIAAI